MSTFITTYRVARPFKFRSRTFRKGEVLRASDPDVARIVAARAPTSS